MYKKAELNRNVDSENNHGGSSRTYVLHRTGCSQKTISYCVKDASGQVHQEGQIGATRWELDGWMIFGVSRFSKRTSRGPYRTAPCMIFLPYFDCLTISSSITTLDVNICGGH